MFPWMTSSRAPVSLVNSLICTWVKSFLRFATNSLSGVNRHLFTLCQEKSCIVQQPPEEWELHSLMSVINDHLGAYGGAHWAVTFSCVENWFSSDPGNDRLNYFTASQGSYLPSSICLLAASHWILITLLRMGFSLTTPSKWMTDNVCSSGILSSFFSS